MQLIKVINRFIKWIAFMLRGGDEEMSTCEHFETDFSYL